MSENAARLLPIPALDSAAQARFWSKVVVRGRRKCWPWIGARGYFGYGFFRLAGRNLMTHRVSYRLAFGPLPPDTRVLHRCDHPPCCNPAHLFLGTQRDNVLDMESKGRGRHPSGEECGASRLTAAMVSAIRRRYDAGGVRQRELAVEFAVTQATISSIVRGETWRVA